MSLVLTRKRGEQIYIGYNVKLTIVSVHGNRVKVAVEAPAEVNVRRADVQEKGRSA